MPFQLSLPTLKRVVTWNVSITVRSCAIGEVSQVDRTVCAWWVLWVCVVSGGGVLQPLAGIGTHPVAGIGTHPVAPRTEDREGK